MQFIFHKQASEQKIILENTSFLHVYYSRRTKMQQSLKFRNFEDDYLYIYKPIHITRKNALLELQTKEFFPKKPKKFSHIIWAIVDVKVIEKTLPFLNELGIGKLSLFYSDLSQKNHKPNIEKLYKILIASCEQSGRSDLFKIEFLGSIDEVKRQYPSAFILDFNGKKLDSNLSIADGVIIGPEGGFSSKERSLFDSKIYSFNTDFILRSQTATIAILSVFL